MTNTTKKPANRLETISCFKCQKQLENITERVANQPDNALEFMVQGGYRLAHAMRMLIAGAWATNALMDEERVAFDGYTYEQATTSWNPDLL